MKLKKLFLFIILICSSHIFCISQNYSPVNYHFNGSPSHGVKIKTNIPFLNHISMVTVIIEGNNYDYGNNKPTGLIINFYIHDNQFYSRMSSFGSDTPTIKLSNENGKVIIFMNTKDYFRRFTVRVFAQGIEERDEYFINWNIEDEPLYGTSTTEVPYENTFRGNIMFPNGIWNENGYIGIGILTPQYRLDVNGTIHAREVKVDLNGWPDFVFQDDYKLMPLQEVEQFIKTNNHLPEIPSEEKAIEKGINLGEMNAKLLQKIEELTLYLIEQNKKMELMQQQINELQQK